MKNSTLRLIRWFKVDFGVFVVFLVITLLFVLTLINYL